MDKELLELEQEILRLKQFKPVSPLIKAYTMYFSSGNQTARYLIEYENGIQPIITEIYDWAGLTALSTPVGNTQYMKKFAAQYTPETPPDGFTIVSTRPIKRITLL